MRRITWLLSVLLAPQAVLAQAPAGQATHAIVSAGVERSYLLHVPAGYDGAAVPLVLNFHGSGGVPENQAATSRLGTTADREGFAIAYPAGAFTNSVTARSWNANVESGVDDIQFARDIIEDASKRVNVDRARIFATGFSGGARMSSRLACELSELLAAAAPVAGLQYPDGCTPTRPIPILAIHGKADRVNHYEWSTDSRPYWRMGVETALDRWRNANGCEGQANVSTFADRIEQHTWSDCGAESEIVFYVIEDGRHIWPDFASDLIWDFFSRHRL